MSGLKADSQRGPSHYLQVQGPRRGLRARACAAGSPEYVIFQPSVVFGPGDAFINNFAGMLRITPGVLPLACADAQFAPVYVGDVARRSSLPRARDVAGRTFQLCGPDVDHPGRNRAHDGALPGLARVVIPLPRAVARVQAAVMDFVPGKPFSTDNYLSATLDSVCDCDGLARTRHRPHRDAQRAAALPARARRGRDQRPHDAAARTLAWRASVVGSPDSA